MRAFVAGLVLGGFGVGLLWLAWAATRSAVVVTEVARTVTTQTSGAAPVPGIAEPRPAIDRSRARVRVPEPEPYAPATATEEPFPPGEAVLRIGDRYDFGADAVIAPGSDGRTADVRCLDIAGTGAELHFAHGGRTADVPLGALGIPDEAAGAVEFLHDAPDDLTPGDVRVARKRRGIESGIALARDARGATYRVIVLAATHDKNALLRTVRIAYAPVPAVPGGGVLRSATTSPADDLPSVRDLENWMTEARRIPGASFTNFLSGDYELLSEPPEELVLRERKYLVLDRPLRTAIEFNSYSGLVAPHGIDTNGRVRIRSYTGVAVTGAMAGTIDVNSYAHVHIRGDLTGSVNVKSYATIVIDGDLIGELHVGSYATVLLRGRLLGKLDIRTSNSKFWFQEWMTRARAEALAGSASGNELHLRLSDVAAGTYDDWSGWSKAHVGEDLWAELAPQ